MRPDQHMNWVSMCSCEGGDDLRLLLLLVKLLMVGLLLVVGAGQTWRGIWAVRWGCEVALIDVRGQLRRVKGG
jgi:hypothetical protein